jgi:hypothetical protein
MKTNDVLLYGGLALAAYLLLKPGTAAGQNVLPGTNNLPAGSSTTSLLNAGSSSNILNSIANALKMINVQPAGQTAAQQQAAYNAQLQADNAYAAAGAAPYTPPAEVVALTPTVIDAGYIAAYGDAGNITDPTNLGTGYIDAGSGANLDMGTISGVLGF